MQQPTLEQEFSTYRIALGFVEQYQQSLRAVTEFNLIKVATEDGETPKVLEGLATAFGNFFSRKIDETGDFLTLPFRSPEEKAAKASIRVVKLLQKSGIEIKQVPNKTIKPIIEGIAYGYEDDCIQLKWQRLLELSMSGIEIRDTFLKVMESLDPVDVRILDYIYKNAESSLDKILDYIKISDQPIELNISLDKISTDLKICTIKTNNVKYRAEPRVNPEHSRNILLNSGEIKSFKITTNEKIHKSGKIENIYVNISFTPLGYGFMKTVTADIAPKPHTQGLQ